MKNLSPPPPPLPEKKKMLDYLDHYCSGWGRGSGKFLAFLFGYSQKFPFVQGCISQALPLKCYYDQKIILLFLWISRLC